MIEKFWFIIIVMVSGLCWIINLWRKSGRRLDFGRNYEMEDYYGFLLWISVDRAVLYVLQIATTPIHPTNNTI